MSRNKGAKTGNEKQAALDALAAAVIKAFNSGALDSRSVVIAAQKEDRIVLRGCVHQVFERTIRPIFTATARRFTKWPPQLSRRSGNKPFLRRHIVTCGRITFAFCQIQEGETIASQETAAPPWKFERDCGSPLFSITSTKGKTSWQRRKKKEERALFPMWTNLLKTFTFWKLVLMPVWMVTDKTNTISTVFIISGSGSSGRWTEQ